MTSRERFLRYCKGNGLLPGTVLTEIWQAAESQALERAAQECERMRAVSGVSYELGTACAKAIRALIEGASSEKEGS